MNKIKLLAKLEEIGVIDDTDVVEIKGHEHYMRVSIISSSDEYSSYQWSNGKLTFVYGECYIPTIEKLMKLEVNDFE